MASDGPVRCVPCAAEYHEECSAPVDGVCCCSVFASLVLVPLQTEEPSEELDRYGGFKGTADSIDPKSTGRKRAAKLYPITNGMSCEWQGLAKAGGNNPIVGCVNGVATHRHHGPNKDTLHNEEGNVHRICTKCHNRWHTRNDPDYNWQGPWEPHDPVTKATDEQLAESEIYWASHKTKKAEKE